MKKLQKNSKSHLFFLQIYEIFEKYFVLLKEKKLLSSQFSNIRNTQFDQSSPVQPASECREGSTSVTKSKVRTNERRKSLCLIQDVFNVPGSFFLFYVQQIDQYFSNSFSVTFQTQSLFRKGLPFGSFPSSGFLLIGNQHTYV